MGTWWGQGQPTEGPGDPSRGPGGDMDIPQMDLGQDRRLTEGPGGPQEVRDGPQRNQETPHGDLLGTGPALRRTWSGHRRTSRLLRRIWRDWEGPQRELGAGGGVTHTHGQPSVTLVGHWDTLQEDTAPLESPSEGTWGGPWCPPRGWGPPCPRSASPARPAPQDRGSGERPSRWPAELCPRRRRLPALRPARHHGRRLLRLPGHLGRLGGDRHRRAGGLRRLWQGGIRSVPFLQVKGPLLVVQLLETMLLCLVNYASLVATNAARFRLLAGPDVKLMEMGLRRAQGPDGALSASKYSYIGGFDFTSNILAGKLYGIPVRGTIAHSFIVSFTSLEEVKPRELLPLAGGEPVDLPALAESWLGQVCEVLQTSPEKANRGELAAFVSYAISFPRDFQGLLDTYCVRRSGLPNFCAVALALHQLGYRAIGVRLDSGDLAHQAKETRRVLRACGAHFQVPWFETIPIAVSNDISEQSLEEFSREGSEIDVVGVGTNLVTCPLQPSLGCVYKLVEVNGSPCLKVTEDEEKMTIPGTKMIYRLYDPAGHPFMDLMALEEEPSPSAGQELEIRVLGQLGETSKVVPTTVEPLHRTYFRDGQVCEPLPSLPEVRNHAQVSLSLLSPAHRRLHEPQPYPVAVTERLHCLLADLRQASQ
ncbi:nicotinate phosphoribosyltransferase isoform X2 [Opisthocomus hoazin]|uniref:nicotinate phosphoribosyltransferase isoform X2 n=1 Tax=Opisthocomus hoazin TaxID=30419 RepID=UPI003F52C6D0